MKTQKQMWHFLDIIIISIWYVFCAVTALAVWHNCGDPIKRWKWNEIKKKSIMCLSHVINIATICIHFFNIIPF